MAADVLADLRDTADALTDPTQIRHPRHGWDHNRHKVTLPDHVVVLPGLLTQLGDMAYPGGRVDDTSGRAVPKSRPPGNPKALVAYLDIHIAVGRWTVQFGLGWRDTVESQVRQLLGAAPTQDHDDQLELLADMRRWLRQCEELTGLRERDPELTAPCPIEGCGQRTLRINLTGKTARCVSCGARWAEQETEHVGNLGVLARHIAAHRQATGEAAAVAWAADRERKAARYGRKIA